MPSLPSPTSGWPGVVAHYRAQLDLPADAPPVTLLEGATPLVPAPRLAAALGGGFELYLKCEGANPTGSFKDRGMTAAITVAAHAGARAVICASTGNTAASAAAYAARAGMRCVVLIPAGKIALGKLAGALSYGAEVVAVEGSFDDCLTMVRAAAERLPITLVNSVNPARIEGQKTAAFEVVDVLGDAPDWLTLPVGNAGNITAYWRGFVESARDGRAGRRPRLLGTQAEGAAPLVHGRVIEKPETVATAIRIGNPARWQEALAALAESDGRITLASDAEILHWYRQVARREGVFCEPASAAGLAGLARGLREGWLDLAGLTVVAVLTGHGLKDPDNALHGLPPPRTLAADPAALERLLGEG